MYRLKKLTRARVEQWLREHPCDKFTQGSSTSCPIARYLRDVCHLNPLVSSKTIRVVGKYEHLEKVETPKWVVKFVDKFDSTHTGRRYVLGKRALEILQSI